MKNPLTNVCSEINKVIFRCPFWRRCPHFNRDACHEAWIMRDCGQYRKYETQEGQRATKLMQEEKQK